MTDGQESETCLDFDHDTLVWVQQLHEAWTNNAPIATFVAFRDRLLDRREHLDTHIATLTSVVKIARSTELDEDYRWNELFALAGLVKSRSNAHDRKRKRTYNETNRVRNLALVAALWSPDVVFHYGWNTASQVQMNILRACAIRFPRFVQDFRPRLNQILLRRHCEGLKHGRAKTLNEARFQPHRDFDLVTLSTADADERIVNDWIINEDGHVSIDDNKTLLSAIRAHHFPQYLLRRDRYGLIAARLEDRRPSSPPLVSLPALDVDADSIELSKTKRPQLSAHGQCPVVCDSVVYGNQDSSSDVLQQTASFPSSPISPSMASSVSSTAAQTSPTAPTSLTSMSVRHSFFDDSVDMNWFSGFDDPTCGQASVESELGFQIGSEDIIPDILATLCDYAEPQTTQALCHPPTIELPPPTPFCCSERFQDILNSLNASCRREPQQDLPEGSTAEEYLNDKYQHEIVAFIRKTSSSCDSRHGEDRYQPHTQWFQPNIKWASIWTSPKTGLPRGRARSVDEATVVCLTSDEAVIASRKGHVFRKPVIIKQEFSDSVMHDFHGTACLLRSASYNFISGVDSFKSDVSSYQALEIALEHLESDSTEPPENPITLKLRSLTTSHRPHLVLLPRFRLLDVLAGCAQGVDSNTAAVTKAPDMSSDINFNLLMLGGGHSTSHVGAMGGTWLRNLDGVKFCTLVSEKDLPSEMLSNSFDSNYKAWLSKATKIFFVLEQDDVLLIPPGLRVMHALHSPTNGLVEGGIIWDYLNILETLQASRWMFEQGMGAGVALRQHLPDLLHELAGLVERQPSHFRGESSPDHIIEDIQQAIAVLRDLCYR